MSTDAIDTAPEVSVIDGDVAIRGPNGVGFSLTKEAAIAFAKRLIEVARDELDDIYQKPLG